MGRALRTRKSVDYTEPRELTLAMLRGVEKAEALKRPRPQEMDVKHLKKVTTPLTQRSNPSVSRSTRGKVTKKLNKGRSSEKKGGKENLINCTPAETAPVQSTGVVKCRDLPPTEPILPLRESPEPLVELPKEIPPEHPEGSTASSYVATGRTGQATPPLTQRVEDAKKKTPADLVVSPKESEKSKRSAGNETSPVASIGKRKCDNLDTVGCPESGGASGAMKVILSSSSDLGSPVGTSKRRKKVSLTATPTHPAKLSAAQEAFMAELNSLLGAMSNIEDKSKIHQTAIAQEIDLVTVNPTTNGEHLLAGVMASGARVGDGGAGEVAYWRGRYEELSFLRETEAERQLKEFRVLTSERENAQQELITHLRSQAFELRDRAESCVCKCQIPLDSVHSSGCNSRLAPTSSPPLVADATAALLAPAIPLRDEYVQSLETKVKGLETKLETQRLILQLYQDLSSLVIKYKGCRTTNGSPTRARATAAAVPVPREGERAERCLRDGELNSLVGERIGEGGEDEQEQEQKPNEEEEEEEEESVGGLEEVTCTAVNHLHRRAVRFDLALPRDGGNVDEEEGEGEEYLYQPTGNTHLLPSYMQHKLSFTREQCPLFLTKLLQKLFRN